VSVPIAPIYEFGSFRLDPTRRLLRRKGETVPLAPKALETLVVLVRHRDRVLEKDQLLKAVWPDTVVEEGNLTVNISLLRKALGDDPGAHRYIVTVPGRGYQFVASVREVPSEIEASENVSTFLPEAAGAAIGVPETGSIPGANSIEAEVTAHSPVHGEQLADSALIAPAGSPYVGTRRLLWAAVVAMGLVAVVSASVWMTRPARPATGSGVKSLAVLPFKPLVSEARDEYLELGMADALITKLSKLQQLTVRPTESILNYTSPGQDLQAAGRRLGVDAVVTGGIQHTGDQLRVTVQLVRAADGSALWAERFDAPWSDVFAMQDAISEQVARALALRLTNTERDLLVKRDTDNPAAYREYLIGRHFWSRRDREAVKKGVQHFEKAVELDPGYALAHAALADSYVLSVTTRELSPKEAHPRARAAAVKALQLNPVLAEAHSTLAVVSLYYDWDWVSAERAFKHAIDLKPDDATAHQRYALALSLRGRFDDALREIRLARDLDPVSPIINTNVGYTLYWARRYQEAIVELRKALAFDPGFSATHGNLARVYVQTRAYAEAIAEFKKAHLLGGSSRVEAYLAHAYAVSGQTRESTKLLDDLKDPSRPTYASPFDVALVYVGLGDHDQAFAWLQKAYDERDRDILSLKVNPVLDPLRSDPRFADLMRRMGVFEQ